MSQQALRGSARNPVLATIFGVPDGSEVDDEVEAALRLALDRTRQAQDHVSEELERDQVPDETSVEIVVERADDLSSLAREAAGDHPGPSQMTADR